MWNLWLPWLLLSAVWMATASGEDGLTPDFYGSACPNAEAIVRDAVRRKLNQTVVTVPATLRLFFHDCFVQVSEMASSLWIGFCVDPVVWG